MPAEHILSQLDTQVSGLFDQLSELRTTVTEYGPAREETVLVDVFSDLADDQREQLSTARQSIVMGRLAAESGEMQTVRQALSQGHSEWLNFSEAFHSRLYTFGRIDDLVRFGRTSNGKWGSWTQEIQDGLNRCQTDMLQIERSLLAAWQACCENMASGPVTIQTISIGHNFVDGSHGVVRSADPPE